MTDPEITQLVSEILREKVPDAGFIGAEVFSKLDFDGDPIIQIIAHYKSRPKIEPDPLLSVSHDLRSELISRGESRFILLKNDVLDERQNEEDID